MDYPQKKVPDPTVPRQTEMFPSTVLHNGLVLGIDGGGSHTVAFLAERAQGGRVIGRGTGGPSNIQAVGEMRALEALDKAVSQAFAEAGRDRGSVAAAALGLAGIDLPETANPVHQWATRVQLADRVDVNNDATLLFAAGTPDGWGLALIAGTGSIAFARTPEGRLDRSGGWGYLLGDEGSAYGLALGGIRAVARASDGCTAPTRLTESILGAMGLKQPLEMIDAVYRGEWDRARLATLAPLVLRAAEEGDSIAAGIVRHEASELAKTAAAVARKLGLPATNLPLAVTGGTMLNNAGYREIFLGALRDCGIVANPVALVAEPAEGAIRVARRLAGSAI